jgi:hypothetical protein
MERLALGAHGGSAWYYRSRKLVSRTGHAYWALATLKNLLFSLAANADLARPLIS